MPGLAGADDKSGVKPSVLSLPSGPGSIEGLGESFEPQLNTGTSSHSIRLKVPPGRAGFAPDLTLAYNSGSGNGPFGLGWSVPLPSLQRQTEKGTPRYTDYPVGDGVDNNHNGITAERPNGYDVPNFHRVTVHGSTFPLEWLSLTVDPRANNTTSASTFGPFSWKRMIQS